MILNSSFDDQQAIIEIDPHIKYGILLSGGLDSAILLYCAVKESVDAGIPLLIQPFTIELTDGTTEKFVSDVIAYVNKKLNVNIPSSIIVGTKDVHHRERTPVAFRDIVTRFPEVDVILQGTNQNPPMPFYHSGAPNRVKNSSTPKNELPFIHLNKAHLVDFMFQLQIDELSNITHSCTEQKVGRCQACFQDAERAWAFHLLNRTDTGTL